MELSLTTELISITALVIALSSTVINYLVLKLQRDPEVVVYALHDERRPTIVNLIIENIGAGAAQDVRFETNRWIPSRAFGFEDADTPKPMDGGPLINGIPSLGRGEKRIITWGQFGGLKKGLGDEVLDISATYTSRPALSLTRQRHKTISSIDLRSFEGTDASAHNWDQKTAENLARIAKAIGQVTDLRKHALSIKIVTDSDDEKKT